MGLSGSVDLQIRVDAAFLPTLQLSIFKLPDDFE
jgi:hypothetical protein